MYNKSDMSSITLKIKEVLYPYTIKLHYTINYKQNECILDNRKKKPVQKLISQQKL